MDPVYQRCDHDRRSFVESGFSVYQQLSVSELIPIIAITAVVFLLNTGVLSGILVGLKKLWERLHKK